MMVPSISNSSAKMSEDADLSLSVMTENSLMISKTQEITKFNTNVLTNANKGGLYSNGLSTMTSKTKPFGESSEGNDAGEEASMGPLVTTTSSQLALPQPDVGLLEASFPDSWNDWESKRRAESMGHQENFYWKKTSKLSNLKRIRRKSCEAKSVSSFRRRRLRLERSVGRHLKAGCAKCTTTEVVPFQSSKSLRRRQRRKMVRFVDEEITEWRRENAGFGRGKSVETSLKAPFLEAERERKKNQRALMDLQVGMKCMGL